jgi:predicted membrane channel-forming protein YqfA (hemolysin III family)
MSQESKSFNSSGFGLGGMVFLIFLIMKLAGIGAVADWSWWWVTSPLWLPFFVIIAVVVLVFIVSFISSSKNK